MKLKQLLPIIGIGILIFILFFSPLDRTKILQVLVSINPGYLVLGFCSIIPIIILMNIEWQLILRKHNIHVSFTYSLKNIFIGYFYGFITPGGFGGYVRAYYLKEESKASLQKCFVDIILFNAVDFISMLFLGVIGGFMLSSRIPRIYPVIVLVFFLIIILTIIFIRKDTGKRVFRKLLESRLLTVVKEKWVTQLDSLYEELPSMTDLISPFFVIIINWLIWITELYFIASLFGIHVSFFTFFAVVTVANVIASIPISIYGLGTRDAALIGLFSLFGVSPESVISFSLFWFVISWIFPSLIGSGITILESKRGMYHPPKLAKKS